MDNTIRTDSRRLKPGTVMAEPIAQTDEEVAELIARFRTPPGFDWRDLRDDILTALKSRRQEIDRLQEEVDILSSINMDE